MTLRYTFGSFVAACDALAIVNRIAPDRDQAYITNERFELVNGWEVVVVNPWRTSWK